MADTYIKIWDTYESYFEPLSAAEVGRLVLAMMKYKSSGTDPELIGNERYVWPAVKRDLDKDAEYIEGKRISGKAGGSSSKRKQNEANASKTKLEKEKEKEKDKISSSSCDETTTTKSPDLRLCREKVRSEAHKWAQKGCAAHDQQSVF